MEKNTIIMAQNPQGQYHISVITAAKYQVSMTGECEFLQEELVGELEYYEDIDYSGKIYQPSILKRDLDYYSWKQATDIVVQGTARTDIPTEKLLVSLECFGENNQIKHTIEVNGDRFIDQSSSGLTLSSPQKFTQMPIRYDKAYGGTDEIYEQQHGNPDKIELMKKAVGKEEDQEISEFSYPRNPAGKGFILDKNNAVGTPWPNLEFIDSKLTLESLVQPLEAWGKRPYPACFDWFAHMWFPRQAFYCDFFPTENGQLPQPELGMGIFPADLTSKPWHNRLSHAFAQGAHPFLWQNRLSGDEKVRLTHMSPDGRDFLAFLPNHRPKIVCQSFHQAAQELDPVIDTVFVETEVSHLTIVWRGVQEVAINHLPPDWEDKCQYSVTYQ